MIIPSGWKCFRCHNSAGYGDKVEETVCRLWIARANCYRQRHHFHFWGVSNLFIKQNGILHTTSAPGHPATNGLAERYVQTFKTGMKKLANTTMNIDDRLSLFLFQYRTTPNCTTGQSPADLFLHRHVCTRLDLLKPCTKETVRKRQYQQKDRHDRSAADRSFSVGDAMYLRSTVGGDPKWIPGLVVRQTGPVSYEVRERDSDTVHRHHGDQLRAHGWTWHCVNWPSCWTVSW